MNASRILVAGVGNVFLGDDGFGVEVVRRLAGRALPPGVTVADFGIRGFDLACALLEPRERVILVDAVRRGEPPGTIFLMEPNTDADGPVDLQGHSMDPAQVIRNARAMGRLTARVLLVGCEPDSFGDPDRGVTGLSSRVEAAVEPAMDLIREVLTEREAHA
ncbi:MAG: hydrogenase maturation protease [Planctomycetes bacterium]|nr:hydrogenase maturation protease [Planctomycetota bacterium]